MLAVAHRIDCLLTKTQRKKRMESRRGGGTGNLKAVREMRQLLRRVTKTPQKPPPEKKKDEKKV
jgi:hypothetical protein